MSGTVGFLMPTLLLLACGCTNESENIESFLREAESHFERMCQWSATASRGKGQPGKLEIVLNALASARKRFEEIGVGSTPKGGPPTREEVIKTLESVTPEGENLSTLILEYGRRSIWDPFLANTRLRGADLVTVLLVLEARTRFATDEEHWRWAYAGLYLSQWTHTRGIPPEMVGASVCLGSTLPQVATRIAKRQYTSEQAGELVRVIERIQPQHLAQCIRATVAGNDLANMFVFLESFPESSLKARIADKLSEIPTYRLLYEELFCEVEEGFSEEDRQTFRKEMTKILQERGQKVSDVRVTYRKLGVNINESTMRKNLLKTLTLGADIGSQIDKAEMTGEPFWYERLQVPAGHPASTRELFPFISAFHHLNKHPATRAAFKSAYMARFVTLCASIGNFIHTNKRIPKNLDEVADAVTQIPEAERVLYRYQVIDGKAVFSLELPEEPSAMRATFGN